MSVLRHSKSSYFMRHSWGTKFGAISLNQLVSCFIRTRLQLQQQQQQLSQLLHTYDQYPGTFVGRADFDLYVGV